MPLFYFAACRNNVSDDIVVDFKGFWNISQGVVALYFTCSPRVSWSSLLPNDVKRLETNENWARHRVFFRVSVFYLVQYKRTNRNAVIAKTTKISTTVPRQAEIAVSRLHVGMIRRFVENSVPYSANDIFDLSHSVSYYRSLVWKEVKVLDSKDIRISLDYLQYYVWRWHHIWKSLYCQSFFRLDSCKGRSQIWLKLHTESCSTRTHELGSRIYVPRWCLYPFVGSSTRN